MSANARLSGAALSAAAWSLPAPAAHLPALANLLGAYCRTNGSGVALSFDDGPHPRGTPATLDILDRHQAKATFFVVGEQVQRHPTLVRDIDAAGHHVAIQGFAHRCQLRLTPRQVADDLDRAEHAIASIISAAPRFHRPPYGIYSLAGSGRGPGSRAAAGAVVPMGTRLVRARHAAVDRRARRHRPAAEGCRPAARR
ncbi:MAG: polysaccharide deacetylase family protein [Acidimicrobiales bacterium]